MSVQVQLFIPIKYIYHRKGGNVDLLKEAVQEHDVP